MRYTTQVVLTVTVRAELREGDRQDVSAVAADLEILLDGLTVEVHGARRDQPSSYGLTVYSVDEADRPRSREVNDALGPAADPPHPAGG